MAMIQFTRNYTDRSNDQGFQFEFHCDKCGNGHMSTFEGSALGMAASFLKAAGSFFGGALSRAAYAGDHVKDALRGKAWDDAYAKAVRPHRGRQVLSRVRQAAISQGQLRQVRCGDGRQGEVLPGVWNAPSLIRAVEPRRHHGRPSRESRPWCFFT